ncbi:unnamed protein product [Allacma fusca]|uniref:CUB domain-containing protein n=1 Tax=Allacma fusca TaxID=39272 RepID=A0A8J2J4M2_9HEXA|nr:unnamed protein product [Allacma fusca]
MGLKNISATVALWVTFMCFLGISSGEQILDKRFGKLFPFFSIVRITNQPCVPESGSQMGTCFTNTQCEKAAGTVNGKCASGFGVCCVVSATCESTITQNNTVFRNRDAPNSFTPTGLELCNVRISKPNSKICQVKLDFISMNLAPADAMGQCMSDRLSINGATPNVPANLCGMLTGQSMYLDFGSSDRLSMSMITDGAANPSARDWNVKVTYYECNAQLRAPDGCLQYFTAATGQVRMLGYPMAPHLADLDYTVCVRPEDGAGSIVWSHCQGEPAGDVFSMTKAKRMDDTMGMPEDMCNMDYVMIMTDEVMSTAVPMPKMNDRYCGNALKAMPPFTVRSTAKPFIMRVKTDSTEPAEDVMNTGFCLAWRQEPPRPK